MPAIMRKIAEVGTPTLTETNKPSREEIETAADGKSFWRLAVMLFREHLPRREDDQLPR